MNRLKRFTNLVEDMCSEKPCLIDPVAVCDLFLRQINYLEEQPHYKGDRVFVNRILIRE